MEGWEVGGCIHLCSHPGAGPSSTFLWLSSPSSSLLESLPPQRFGSGSLLASWRRRSGGEGKRRRRGGERGRRRIDGEEE